MGIFAFLHRRACIVAGIHDLTGKTLFHRLLAAFTRITCQPAKAKSLAALRSDFNRNLVGCTADAACLNFQGRHDIIHCLGECFQGVFSGLFLDHVKGLIDNLLGNTLFAVQHNAVYQLGDQHTIVYRIRQDFSFGNITSSGHYASLLHYEMISTVLESSKLPLRPEVYKKYINNRALLMLGQITWGASHHIWSEPVYVH